LNFIDSLAQLVSKLRKTIGSNLKTASIFKNSFLD